MCICVCWVQILPCALFFNSVTGSIFPKEKKGARRKLFGSWLLQRNAIKRRTIRNDIKDKDNGS